MMVTIAGQTLTIRDPSAIGRARWNGTLSPEPETVAWIESLPAGAVFFDVGASVGTLSVRAALRGLQVYAFEPHAERYAELCRVCADNDLARIQAYPLAITDVNAMGRLGAGRSSDTFYQDATLGQSALSMRLDTVAELAGIWPDYLKIDVDGNEVDVLKGAARMLTSVRALLIEVDPGIPGQTEAIRGMLTQAGFTYDAAQVAACRVRGGKYDGMANWIFTK